MPKVFSEPPPRTEDASWGVHSLPFSGCTCLQAVALDKSQGFGEGLKEVKESQVNGSAGSLASVVSSQSPRFYLDAVPPPTAQGSGR